MDRKNFRNPFSHADDDRRHNETVGFLRTIIANQKSNTEKIMSALSDLQSALADLGTALTTNNAEIETLLGKITAPGTSDADIEAAVTSIRGLISTNAAEVAKAQAAAP
jgi:chromosome segregation ATPase